MAVSRDVSGKLELEIDLEVESCFGESLVEGPRGKGSLQVPNLAAPRLVHSPCSNMMPPQSCARIPSCNTNASGTALRPLMTGCRSASYLPKGKYSKKNTSSFCRPSQTLPYLIYPSVEVQNVILWIFFHIRRESVAVLYFTIEELPGLRRSPHQSGTAVGGHLRCIQLWERNKLYENIKGVIPIPTSIFVATREGILQRGPKGIKLKDGFPMPRVLTLPSLKQRWRSNAWWQPCRGMTVPYTEEGKTNASRDSDFVRLLGKWT